MVTALPANHPDKVFRYRDIVRRWTTTKVVEVVEGPIAKLSRWLRGKKAPPKKTKTITETTHEATQTVIESGWRRVYLCMKHLYRAGRLRVNREGRILAVPR